MVWGFLDLCVFVVTEVHKNTGRKGVGTIGGSDALTEKWCGVVWYPYFTPPSLRLSLLSSQGTLDISQDSLVRI